MKKLWYKIQLLSDIWGVAFMFAAFIFSGFLLQTFGGYDIGVYDLAFIQPLFLAACAVLFANGVAIGGLYFTFRGLYRYFYGQKDEKGNRRNFSKENWTHLSAWQRYFIAFFVFFYYVTATIVVYLHLV